MTILDERFLSRLSELLLHAEESAGMGDLDDVFQKLRNARLFVDVARHPGYGTLVGRRPELDSERRSRELRGPPVKASPARPSRR